MITLNALPTYEPAELSALTEQQLLDLMVKDEDRVPRNVIDECARRGDAMVTALQALAAQQADWHDATNELGEWWLCLHAVMILGLIDSDAAGDALLIFMRRIDVERDESLADWVTGYWPTLFANKTSRVIEPLKEIARDDTLTPWMRHEASDACVFWFRQTSGPPLEAALDWLAGLVTDKNKEQDIQLLSGNLLLEYPRPRFRTMLEELADEQTGWSRIFDKNDVARAFQRNTDQSKREPFDDPWRFYTPEQIEQRQRRWQEEDAARERRANEYLPSSQFDPEFEDGYEFAEPFVRDAPKIGRNDPCPCGSGKKYKKCCLGKDEE